MKDFLNPFKDELKKIPGLGWVVSLVLLAFFTADALHLMQLPSHVEIYVVIVTWLICWFLYRVGSRLDDWLFDRLFSPDDDERGSLAGKLSEFLLPHLEKMFLPDGRSLHASRLDLADVLDRPVRGIHEKAKAIVAGTKDWEDHVRRPLEVSKAARTVIIPSCVGLMYGAFCALRGKPIFAMLDSRSRALNLCLGLIVPMLILVLSTLLYFGLRIRHMVALYRLVRVKPIRFEAPGARRKLVVVNSYTRLVKVIAINGLAGDPTTLDVATALRSAAGLDVDVYLTTIEARDLSIDRIVQIDDLGPRSRQIGQDKANIPRSNWKTLPHLPKNANPVRKRKVRQLEQEQAEGIIRLL